MQLIDRPTEWYPVTISLGLVCLIIAQLIRSSRPILAKQVRLVGRALAVIALLGFLLARFL
jgi:hypothetical protein